MPRSIQPPVSVLPVEWSRSEQPSESAVGRLLRQRPETWLFPAVALALITSFTELGQTTLGPAVLRRLAFITPDPILPFTLAAAFVVSPIAWLCFRRMQVGMLRSSLLSLTVPVGAVGGFEIPYQLIRGSVYPTLDGGPIGLGGLLGLAAWVIVGLSAIGFWKFSWTWVLVLIGTTAGFFAWWAVGFPQVTSGGPNEILVAYIFNVPLKFAAFGIFVIPLDQRTKLMRHGTQ
jgi:hypothetical protein